MRLPKQRFRIKLGAFYLQGDSGWGAREHASVLTHDVALTKMLRLRMGGFNCTITDT